MNKLAFVLNSIPLILLITVLQVNAQDVIFKMDGSEINSVVLEVGVESVSYKNYSNKDGATIVLPNSELLLIKFEDGTKHIFAKNRVGSDSNNDSKFKLGQNYGGGIIFYVDDTGEHGLIAAEEDVPGLHQWGRAQKRIGASSYSEGQQNTKTISKVLGSEYAGGRCSSLNTGGVDDWYLPAIDELERLYRNRSHIPTLDFIGQSRNRFDYVSSTEYKNRNDCWAIHFSRGGKHFYYNKRNEYSVRCVRKF